MLTRRKAALLKSDADSDQLPQKENEEPLASPGNVSRTVTYKSNKTPRAHSRGDAEVERPSKRRRESPALEIPSVNLQQSTSGPEGGLKAGGTPILTTPRLEAREEEKVEMPRLWLRSLQFSVCFVVFYILFWMLLLRIANVSPLEDPSEVVTDESMSSEDAVRSLDLKSARKPPEPFFPFEIVNTQEASQLESEYVQTLLQYDASSNSGIHSAGAVIILKEEQDCQLAWRNYSNSSKIITSKKGCIFLEEATCEIVWLEASSITKAPYVSNAPSQSSSNDEGITKEQD